MIEILREASAYLLPAIAVIIGRAEGAPNPFAPGLAHDMFPYLLGIVAAIVSRYVHPRPPAKQPTPAKE